MPGEHGPEHVPRITHHLPPPEAWRQPDKWIDTKTGHRLDDIKKLDLITDDRKIVLVNKSVDYIKSELFWDDYDFLNGTPVQTRLDEHHFHFTELDYDPSRHNGNKLPKKFRESAPLIGLTTRSFHDVLHTFVNKPEMPDYDAMEEFRKNYLTARKIFEGVIRAAHNTMEGYDMFAARERTLQAGNVKPLYDDDRVAQEFLREFFSRNFLAYHEHVDKARNLVTREEVFSNTGEMLDGKPHVVAKKLSRFVVRSNVNLVPLLKAA